MRISVEELRAKAAKFNKRIRRRNIREYVAAVIVIGWAGMVLWRTPYTVERIGFALIIAGAIYYMWYLKKWAAPKSVPADMGRADCVRFYQSELERQRDLLRSVWKWALGPIIPGMTLLCVYLIVVPPSGHRWVSVANLMFQAAALSGLVWLNLRAARRLDRRIKELDRELVNT
ncbi:MAG: hypothetical protein WCC92_07420 [Candidatus Korobacteraceae bacterium]